MSDSGPVIKKDEVWVSPTSAKAKKPWYKSKTAIVIGAIILLSAIGNAMNKEPQTAAPTVTVTADSSAVEPAAEATPEESTAVEETPAAEETPAEAVAETFKMPSVVGMNLQDAQDLLQSLGSYVMDQEDASGRGRLQLLDRNWKVCTQDPGAGKSVDISAVVTLGSVKLGESCP